MTLTKPAVNSTVITQPQLPALGGGASAGTLRYSFNSGDTLQGASAADYTVDQNNLPGLRLAKASGLENLVWMLDGRTLAVTYIDTDLDPSGAHGLRNVNTVVNSVVVADPYGGSANTLFFTRANTEYLQATVPVLDGTGDWTIEGWFRPVQAGINNSMFTLGQDGGGDIFQSDIGIRNFLTATNKWQYDVHDAWLDSSTSFTNVDIATSVIDTWVHRRLTFKQGDNHMNFYDGGSRADEILSFPAIGTHDWNMLWLGVIISSSGAGTVHWWDGYMSDIRIFREERGDGAVSITVPTAYEEVYSDADAQVWTDYVLDLGSTQEIDLGTIAFEFADGQTGPANTKIVVAANDTGVFTAGSFGATAFEDGGSVHANPVGQFVAVALNQDSGVYTNPARLLNVSFDLV